MAAHVKIDAYHLSALRLDGGNRLLPPPNAARAGEDSVERQHSYKVLVTLNGELIGRGQWTGVVKPGMICQAEIITDPRTILAVLIRRIRSWISLG